MRQFNSKPLMTRSEKIKATRRKNEFNRKLDRGTKWILAFILVSSFSFTMVKSLAAQFNEYQADMVRSTLQAQTHVISHPGAKETPTVKDRVEKVLQSHQEIDGSVKKRILDIIQCESNFNEFMIHKNNDKGHSLDRGVAQWSDNKAWNDVSNECAFNVECSMEKMIEAYKKNGNLNLWTCNKLI